jgi:hypothetical protein
MKGKPRSRRRGNWIFKSQSRLAMNLSSALRGEVAVGLFTVKRGALISDIFGGEMGSETGLRSRSLTTYAFL